MEDLYDIDNCMDDREFRNYVYAILPRLGFENVGIEDVRISDEDKINDNDLFASKNGFSYTVQTYLNKEINQKIINECFKDMEKEHVTFGLIVTNVEVSDEIKEEAKRNNIEILDREVISHHKI